MQTIQREVLTSHFVPNTAGGVRQERESGNADVSAYLLGDGVDGARHPSVRKTGRSPLMRVASTVFWAVLGHKTFVRAISQDRIPAAIVGGSVAAGTAYLRERSAQRTRLVSPHAVSKRSVFSLYAVIGLGLGLGATLVNRRRY